MKTISIFVALFSLSPSFLLAQELGHIGTQLAYKETSEGIYLKTLKIGATNHRRDLFWPYANEADVANDLMADFTYNTGQDREYEVEGKNLRLGAGRKFSKQWDVLALAGIHQYSGENSAEKIEHTSPSLFVQVRNARDNGNTRLKIEYDPTYDDLQLPAGINKNLRTLEMRVSNGQKIAANQKIYSSIAHKIFTSDNSRNQADATYFYKASPSEWMPWLGFGFEYLSTRKNVNGYWTPRNQSSFGPRIEWSYWHSESFSFGFGSSINRYYDSSAKKWGWGHYTAGTFYLGDRNKMHSELELVRMDSSQDGGDWNEFDIVANFKIPF